MTKESRRKKILWLEHLFWMLGAWTLLGVAIAVIGLGSGLLNPVLRHFLVNRLQNLTASRVSTERVRKLRLFQPHEYISLDYGRQDAVRFRVKPPMAIDFVYAARTSG